VGGASGKEVWITGKMEETSRKQFVAKGWQVKENANDVLL